MALKPPPIGEVIQQMNDLVGSSGLREDVDRGVRTLAQAAMKRLDVVSREEFDAQAAVLQRTRARVAALEAEMETLTREVEALEKGAR
ncbi:accessory factor UbiK family protein [Parahaliea aestuarii]|uniref:Ubiquinone biosynthesis accessory factor UbiK n=1 Tax=Parahaliea aestuarii TaxID=1852021 RepID=A0A5C8ZS05_9GAMM|nr:accessory factor UbiK family protein [Parahaliea aestuarii]TXS90584.1 accessory factor UbiK family protein [Parahaliea aestuarii]